jgi:hypothetical protein
MLRSRNKSRNKNANQPSLVGGWLRRLYFSLPGELLSDERFLEPFGKRFSADGGTRSTPIDVYLLPVWKVTRPSDRPPKQGLSMEIRLIPPNSRVGLQVSSPNQPRASQNAGDHWGEPTISMATTWVFQRCARGIEL